jgi:hypothetical protein
MDGHDAEAVAQARMVGWLMLLTVKVIAWAVRLVWWLLSQHAWALLIVAVMAVNARLVPSPLVDDRVHAAFSVLLVWAALGLAWPPTRKAFKAHRVRRVARAAGGQLERPRVQAWLTARVPGGERVQAGTGEALRVWAGWNRVRRQLRRDLADVHGGRPPKAVRAVWEQLLANQETSR